MGMTNSQFKSYMRSLLLNAKKIKEEQDPKEKERRLEELIEIMQDAIEDN